MASSVTAPLERQFGQVPGLQQMTSISSEGMLGHHARVRSQPEYRRRRAGGAAIHQCFRNLLSRRSSHAAALQQNQPGRHADPDSRACVRHIPLSKVEDLADTRLAPKISQLPGVGLVSISGGQKPAVRIQANPAALASYGINHGGSAQRALSPRTSIRPRATSMGRASRIRLAPTISCFPVPITPTRRRLQERRSRQDDRGGRRGRQRRGHSRSCVDEPDSRRDREHSAAAGRQHHLRGGPHQSACCRSSPPRCPRLFR